MDSALFDGELVQSDRIIYTPSSFAKVNLLHLQEIGELQARQPHTSERGDLASFLYFVVLSGSGELEYEGTRTTLIPGDCVFLDCHRHYLHRTSQNLWRLKWVHFYGPNLSAIYKKYRERGGRPCYHARNVSACVDLLEELHTLAASDDYLRDMRIFEKLTSLLTLLMEESWHPGNGQHNGTKKQNLQEIKEYLDTHYSEKITLDELAERFYINKFYLSRVFKEQFGTSVNGYLLQLRITHAKRLLRFTDWPIEKIGQECGMNDANYFSRTFKKVEGIAPGQFRRQW
ncbi:MAG: helix-turn-helix domain-containing protein [Gemmiger sp.]